MLSKRQQWDWYDDPFWRVQTLFVVCVLGLGSLIFRELRISNPVVDFRPLAERNLAACCVIIFCSYGVLYGASTSLPGLLQTRFGYDAYLTGLVQSPSGFFSILMMVAAGALLGRGMDARWLIVLGLLGTPPCRSRCPCRCLPTSASRRQAHCLGSTTSGSSPSSPRRSCFWCDS